MKTNGENKFALVRRPSSAVEKAAPGAKRILSGMVADSLALAQKVDAEELYQKHLTYKCTYIGDPNYHYALSLLRRAAEMGHPEAMYDWGMYYWSGYSQDKEQGFFWLRKAAEQGHGTARIYVGVLFEKAHTGRPFLSQDLPEAYKWFKLAIVAAERPETIGQHFLDRLLPAMTPDQIQEGERHYCDFQSSKK